MAATHGASANFGNELVALRPHLVRFARHRLHDLAEAEDVAHDALLAALEQPQAFQGRASLRTWVTAIAKHRVTDRHRSRQREAATDPVHFDLIAQGDSDPCDLASRAQFVDSLQHCVTSLEGRSARVFELNDCLGASTDEICQELDISRTNCWTLLHRARQTLRAGLVRHRPY
jgi:RNA polymerase sigma-70 factor, ECF subfamily